MIIHQPLQNRLGDILINQMNSDQFTLFRIIVAYAKMSGVNRILPYIRSFRSKGFKVEVIVGIDQKHTSYEALSTLLQETDCLWIYHSSKAMLTFHPKVYYFTNENSGWFAIGSNNLTAGGLFNNYEVAYCNTLGSDDTSEINALFQSYSDEASPCCKIATTELISQLLHERYISTEKQQIAELISSFKKPRSVQQRARLFGSDILPAHSAEPTIPQETSTLISQDTLIPDDTDSILDSSVYLVRFIPKAGNRSKQVHFNMAIQKNFFKLNIHESLKMQYIDSMGAVYEFEDRKIVFSQRNKNVKVELAKAESLDDHYPTDPSKRPILIMKRIGEREFSYTILLDGDNGYTNLNSFLTALPKKGNTLAYELFGEEKMLELWPDCPIL